MSGEAFVNDARKWADYLVMREYQGPGQLERSMERASQKTGVDYGTFWGLRYRPPRDILTSVYFTLKMAYEAEVERQRRLYQHERTLTDAVNPSVVRAADFVAGKEAGE